MRILLALLSELMIENIPGVSHRAQEFELLPPEASRAQCETDQARPHRSKVVKPPYLFFTGNYIIQRRRNGYNTGHTRGFLDEDADFCELDVEG